MQTNLKGTRGDGCRGPECWRPPIVRNRGRFRVLVISVTSSPRLSTSINRLESGIPGNRCLATSSAVH